MGIVNITPDSFADGGRFTDATSAIAQAEKLLREGADILDLGAESTRPGAAAVDEEAEWLRLAPVLRALRDSPVPISVDTMKPAVMRRAIDAGAAMINDICALVEPGALAVLAASDAAVCLMHMQGEPRTMQAAPIYADVVRDVDCFLRERVAVAQAAGIAPERIVVDPGFGFGKTLEHNLHLLRHLAVLCDKSPPLLAGLSRKSSLGRITGRPVEERLAGSLAAALIALAGGARILRVHDVAPTRDIVAVWQAVRQAY